MKKLIYYIVAVVLLLGLSSTMPTSSSPHKHLSIEEYILGLYVQDTFTKLGLSYSQKNLAKPIQLYGEKLCELDKKQCCSNEMAPFCKSVRFC
jgi:hypothetical protein